MSLATIFIIVMIVTAVLMVVPVPFIPEKTRVQRRVRRGLLDVSSGMAVGLCLGSTFEGIGASFGRWPTEPEFIVVCLVTFAASAALFVAMNVHLGRYE